MTRPSGAARRARGRQPFLPLVLSLLAAGGLASCGSSSDDDDQGFFVVTASQGHTLATSPIVVRGNWAVYLQEETAPGGATFDLNDDPDFDDSVAVAIRLGASRILPIRVAPRAVHVLGDEVFLEVVESDDGRDWNGDTMMDDIVIVHWREDSDEVPVGAGMMNAEGAVYVDDLVAGDGVAASVGGALYYVSATAEAALGGGMDGDTSLRVLGTGDPTMPIPVLHDDTGQRRPRIAFGDPSGLLFLTYDETVEGLMLNGDLDMADTRVLALFDTGNEMARIQPVGLALPPLPAMGPDVPMDARPVPGSDGDFLVAFFVSEAEEGASLNDASAAPFAGTAWEPAQCTATGPDVDTNDVVVHYLHFLDWSMDPVMSPPRNTGLVGRDPAMGEPNRLVVVEDFVAVLSDESSASCDLNGDTDTADTIARWVRAETDPMVDLEPPGDLTQLHAVDVDVDGGSQGLADLASVLVILVDEMADGDDIDGDGNMNRNLVGWLNPFSTTNTTFDFTHGGSGDPVGATFLGRRSSGAFLPVAFQESVAGQSLNSACADLSLADADTTDELPTWARFSSTTTLSFPGVGVATDPGNAGLVINRNIIYFRADETGQGQDLNQDGDEDDHILVLNSLFLCDPLVVGTASATNPLGFEGILATDPGARGVTYLASEADAGVDLNKNGIANETVVMFFRVP